MNKQQLKKHVLAIVRSGHRMGKTPREIRKASRHAREVDIDYLLQEMASESLVVQLHVAHYSGRGVKRVAWVCSRFAPITADINADNSDGDDDGSTKPLETVTGKMPTCVCQEGRQG